MANEIDLEKSKGTDQEVISSLTPPPASLTVDENVTFKVIFNVELDENHVKKNDIKLKNISDTHQNIDGTVAYVASEKAVTFKAEQPLAEGYYEIEFKSLKATKANKDEQIKEIKYRFYVPEVINGHMLPPVPDETLNNSTILGVDVNENGVRDDVERKIYYQYPKKLHSALLMDGAKQFQKVLSESLDNAKNTQKYISRIIHCRVYLIDIDTEIGSNDFEFIDFLENYTFDNPNRVRRYLDYNLALSGGNFASRASDWERVSCSPEVVSALEEAGL
jgi:hypothetical protein